MSSEIKAKKTYIRDNEDGTPYFNYDFTDVVNTDTHAIVLTGPITGPLTMEDGTVYNVTDFAIAVKHEHNDEVTGKIQEAHEVAGTFTQDEE